MHGRSPVAALMFTVAVAVACAAALPGAASAQGPTTLDQAMASVGFPVYEITRAPGLPRRPSSLIDHTGEPGCPNRSRSVHTDYLPRAHRHVTRWLRLTQYGKPCRPNDPAGKKVRRIKVLGQRVTIHLYCAGTPLACPHSPRRNGTYVAEFYLRSGGRRTQLIFNAAARVGLRGVVRALRSLRLVDVTRPVVSLYDFRSPDGGIFCMLRDDKTVPSVRYAFCAAGDRSRSVPERSAWLGPDGTVSLCDQDPLGCWQNWDATTPRLAAGQTSRFGRFTCTEQAGGITCTLADGEHAGAGFRIDSAGVTAVVP